MSSTTVAFAWLVFNHDAPLCAVFAEFVGDVAVLVVVAAVACVLLVCWYGAFAQCSFLTQVSAVRAVDHRFPINASRTVGLSDDSCRWLPRAGFFSSLDGLSARNRAKKTGCKVAKLVSCWCLSLCFGLVLVPPLLGAWFFFFGFSSFSGRPKKRSLSSCDRGRRTGETSGRKQWAPTQEPKCSGIPVRTLAWSSSSGSSRSSSSSLFFISAVEGNHCGGFSRCPHLCWRCHSSNPEI